MKIDIYGAPPDMRALAELIKYVPPFTQEVKISSNARRAIDIRPCQHPGMLFMDAICDGKLVIHLSQKAVGADYLVLSTILGG